MRTSAPPRPGARRHRTRARLHPPRAHVGDLHSSVARRLARAHEPRAVLRLAGVPERIAFTGCGLAVLVFPLLPWRVIEWVFGDLAMNFTTWIVSVLLIVIAAPLLPARRVSRIRPAEALRYQ